MEFELSGIVINKQNVNEFDEIISLLTNKGIQRIFCPGVNKTNSKNGPSILILNLVNCEVIKSETRNLLPRLKTASLIKNFPTDYRLLNIANDLKTFFSCLDNCNNINLIKEYGHCLDFILSKSDKVEAYLLFLVVSSLGFKPNLNSCIECNNVENIVDFKLYKGGFLCSMHSNIVNADVSLLRSWYWINKKFEQFDLNCSNLNAIKINNELKMFLYDNNIIYR